LCFAHVRCAISVLSGTKPQFTNHPVNKLAIL
jgi:hypothetical protein